MNNPSARPEGGTGIFGAGPGRTFLHVCAALLPILAVLAFWKASTAFLILFSGVVLAAFLDAGAHGLGRLLPVGRGFRLAIVIVLVLLALVGAGWWSGPRLYEQSRQLAETVLGQAEALVEMVQEAEKQNSDDGGDAPPLDKPVEDITKIAPVGGGVLQGLRWLVSVLVSTAGNAFLIVFIGLFLVIAPDIYLKGVVRLVPPNKRHRIAQTFRDAGETLRHWVVGTLASMAVISALTLAGLLVIGYPFALPLALLAGALAFIPNIGPLITYVPIVLVGLSQGGVSPLWGAGIYALAQGIESYVVTPLIQQKAVSLPPALVLFAQVLLGLLFGLFGVALATPIVAVLGTFVDRLYVEDVLGDRGTGSGAS